MKHILPANYEKKIRFPLDLDLKQKSWLRVFQPLNYVALDSEITSSGESDHFLF